MFPRRNVLIFHLGALGDFVLTWPIALALGRLHPQSRVFYVTHASKGRLAERALGVESADIEAGGWHALFAEGAASLPAATETLLASAHTVVTFLSDGQDAWARNVRRLSSPDVTLVPLDGPTLARPPIGEHAAGFVERQLHPWPALATAVAQIHRSIATRGVGGRGTPDGTVVIHPGSGAESKRWPVERFADLARRLASEGRAVRFVIGEVEAARWPAGAIDALGEAASVERPVDLVELWNIVRAASLFIGNDSGPAHLAGIIGVPTVVIYGPTTPEVWKPLGPKVACVRGDPIERVTVEQVLDAARNVSA